MTLIDVPVPSEIAATALEGTRLQNLMGLQGQCLSRWQDATAQAKADYPRFALSEEEFRFVEQAVVDVPGFENLDEHYTELGPEKIAEMRRKLMATVRRGAMDTYLRIMDAVRMSRPGDEDHDGWLATISLCMCRLGEPGDIGDVKCYLRYSIAKLNRQGQRRASAEVRARLNEVEKGEHTTTLSMLRIMLDTVAREFKRSPMLTVGAKEVPYIFHGDEKEFFGLHISTIQSEYHLYQALLRTLNP